ncbi:MAG: hypothetical protein LBD89_03190 [Tannerellaceae bacterium]|nr:hypothetical protein [Tannerellaceae bacterium]
MTSSTDLLPEGLNAADYNITTPAGTLLLVPQQSVKPNVKLTGSICDGCSNTPSTFERNGSLQSSNWNAGESTTYNFTLDIQNDVYCWGFEYTGATRTFVAPKDGTYRLEAWGAQGGVWNSDVNKGGYTAGTITLTLGQIVYIYVGQAGIIVRIPNSPMEETRPVRAIIRAYGVGSSGWEDHA